MKNKYFFLMILNMALFFSCQKDDGFTEFKSKNTKTQTLAGEWWVKEYNEDLSLTHDFYFSLETFNTASNNDSIWITDNYLFKAKGLAVPSNLSFETAKTENILIEGDVISIYDGQVLKNKGVSLVRKKSVDSLYFKINYRGNTKVISGHRKTGFDKDTPPSPI